MCAIPRRSVLEMMAKGIPTILAAAESVAEAGAGNESGLRGASL